MMTATSLALHVGSAIVVLVVMARGLVGFCMDFIRWYNEQ